MTKEFPERELIRKTFTIREMDLPPNVLMTKKSMIRWFALSFGLISEKESRDTILEILEVLFYFNFAKKQGVEADEVYERLKSKGINVTDKLIRYHLKRLADLGLLEKKGKKYLFSASPDSEREDIKAGFEHNAGNKIRESVERIGSILEKIKMSYQ